MSSTPREIGTLIVVVLRANHLPNKRHIGKQDPYCLVTVNGEKRRTKAIKRGGQHPEWDEEIRFTLFDDVDDVLARTAHGDSTPPPLPPKDEKRIKKIKGGKTMKVACYADDPREPDLIGDVEVDLTEVLTKGETDEWFTLTNKDKFAGKVYLELTFWSNEPPPEKKTAPKVPKNNKQYGGPGSFTPSGDLPPGSRIVSANAAYNNHLRQSSDVLPSSLRASSSAANLDLYVAPYERNRNTQIDNLARDFGEFGMSNSRRRESFPPIPGQYTQGPQQVGSQYSTFTNYPVNGYTYDRNIPENGAGYPYDRPLSPNDQMTSHYQQSSASTLNGYGSQAYQQPGYEITSPSSYQPVARGPRHSVPTSSGFVPLPQASGFVPISSHVSEPSGFAPPLSHTPAPNGYNSQYNAHPQSTYYPSVSHTPAPANNSSYLQHSTSLSYPHQPFPSSQSYTYNYGIPSSVSAPPQQYISSPPIQPGIPPQANPTSPHVYTSVSPSHEIPQGQVPPPPPPPLVPVVNGQSSRPLPQQPQVVYTQQPVQSPAISSSHSLPPPNSIAQPGGSYSPTPPGNIYPSNAAYSPVPPPPPPPTHQYDGTPPAMSNAANLSVPPPPPPPTSAAQPRRRASLPQPPLNYHPQQQPQQQPQLNQEQQQIHSQQQSVYLQGQSLPPPPPPPMDYYNQNHLPVPPPPPPQLNQPIMAQSISYQQVPPPKPPQVDEYGQWIQPNSQQASQAY